MVCSYCISQLQAAVDAFGELDKVKEKLEAATEAAETHQEEVCIVSELLFLSIFNFDELLAADLIEKNGAFLKRLVD